MDLSRYKVPSALPVSPPSSGGAGTFALNAASYGAVGDGKRVVACTIAATDTLLTSPLPVFSSSDVGKLINIAYPTDATEAPDSAFTTTIAQFIDATAVRLAVASSISTPYADVLFGTDDTSALANCLAAIQASSVFNRMELNLGTFLTTEKLELTVNYKGIVGAMDSGFIWGDVPPGTWNSSTTIVSGTRLAYVGVKNTTTRLIRVTGSATKDIFGAFLTSLEIDGRFAAEMPLDLRATLGCQFSGITTLNPSNTTTSVSFNNGSLTHSATADYPAIGATRINCTYRNTYSNINVIASKVGHGLTLDGLSGYGGTNCCFLNFYNVNAIAGTGDALRVLACDDVAFYGMFTGCAATGRGLALDSTVRTKGVESLTIYGALIQGGSIKATGGLVKGCWIYGLSGTDNNLNVTISGGATLYFDYLSGSGQSSPTAVYSRIPPFEIEGNYLMKFNVATPAAPIYSNAAIGTYAGKIRIKVDNVDAFIPIYR